MDMERLTKRINGYAHGAEGVSKEKLTGKYCRGRFEATACVDRLAEYEDMFPCMPGDIVYKPNTLTRNEIIKIKIESIFKTESATNISGYTTNRGYAFCFSPEEVGASVFLTKEEAEQKLKEMESNND